MNWKKAIGFGVLLWVLMFVIVSIFIAFGIYDFLWMMIVTAVIAGLISFILAGFVKPRNVGLALGYGLAWVVVGVILDLIVTMRFNPTIFASWTLWLGYVLILLAPLLRVKKVPAAQEAPAPEIPSAPEAPEMPEEPETTETPKTFEEPEKPEEFEEPEEPVSSPRE